MKPLSEEAQQKKVEKLTEVLAPLGFEHGKDCRFFHPAIENGCRDFDFSAVDEKTIVVAIFNEGLKWGHLRRMAMMRAVMAADGSPLDVWNTPIQT